MWVLSLATCSLGVSAPFFHCAEGVLPSAASPLLLCVGAPTSPSAAARRLQRCCDCREVFSDGGLWLPRPPPPLLLLPFGVCDSVRRSSPSNLHVVTRAHAPELSAAVMQTLYDVLRVPMSASQDEIRHAYRRLLVRFHPDRCYHDNDSVAYNTARKQDEVRMNLLNKAYKVLSNPKRRGEYDAYLTRQLRSNSSAYHQSPHQVRRPQGTVQPQVFAFGGGANRSVSGMAGVVRAMMTMAVDGNTAPATAGTAPASGQPISTAEGARGDSMHSQYANPMTRALGTSFGVAGEAAATVPEGGVDFSKQPSSNTPSSVSIVYTDSVSVRTIKAGPRTVGFVVVTEGGVAPGTPASTETPEDPPQQQQQPSAAAAVAIPSVSDVHLPRRIRVIEEHLIL